MSRRTTYLLVSLVPIAALGFFALRAFSGSGAADISVGDYKAMRAHTVSLFDGHTPQEALALFKAENEKRAAVEQHDVAHIFGEVLYEKEGLQGFTVCDGSFGFGCYHSFLGRAITDYGPDVVQQLDTSCIEAYGEGGIGCSHGIGHGLLSYFGYSLADVTHALTACSHLSWARPLGGCSDGVFMEYNFRVMETKLADRQRAFTEEDTYEPCASLSLYKEGCYFGLPAWWLSALKGAPQLPERLGGYCADAGTTVLRRACYRGLGYGAPPFVQFDEKAAARLCDDAASGEARLWCREGLAWALYADPATREKVSAACTDGLSQEEQKRCESEFLFVIQ